MVKKFPRFIGRKPKPGTHIFCLLVLFSTSVPYSPSTSPAQNPGSSKYNYSFIPPFIQYMCNELSDMQATPSYNRKQEEEEELTGN